MAKMGMDKEREILARMDAAIERDKVRESASETALMEMSQATNISAGWFDINARIPKVVCAVFAYADGDGICDTYIIRDAVSANDILARAWKAFCDTLNDSSGADAEHPYSFEMLPIDQFTCDILEASEA